MEIKKDPAYEKPRRILGKLPARTANKYCALHDANGYNTETYISLRVLIERFIENEKACLVSRGVEESAESGSGLPT